MSKFKVGDKVKEVGSNEIKEIGLISFFDDGTIGYVLKFDDSEMYYEDELELYKTPHQELLDLGWKLEIEAEEGLKYSKDNMKAILTISKIIKKYWVNCQGTFSFDLQLAKILVRYLEELE